MVAGRLAYADPNLKVMLIEGTHLSVVQSSQSADFLCLGGANNRDDPWVYRSVRSLLRHIDVCLLWRISRPGIYVRNMQNDGVYVVLHCPFAHQSNAVVNSNDKATFYTDTMQSPFMRGRRSIVP